MKKIIGLLAGAAVIAVAAFIFLTAANNPEKQVVGKWTDAGKKYSFQFTNDGKVFLPAEFFELGQSFQASDLPGTYVIDKKDEEIVFSFNFYGVDYKKICDYEIKGETLTLIKENGKTTVLTKQEVTP